MLRLKNKDRRGDDKMGEELLEETLKDRGAKYGRFIDHAMTTQWLKKVMQKQEKWPVLAADQKEALEMIAHKIGRILNGDPNYADSWHDIAGYAELVAKRLRTGETI